MICRPSVRPPFSKIFSKTAGPIKAKFHWSLSGMGEWKFVCGVWVTWPRWLPCPYKVKTLQKSSPGPKGQWPYGLVCSIGAWAIIVCWNDDPRLTLTYFTARSNLVSCFYTGKTIRKSFNGRNLQQMTRVTKGLCLYKNSDPKGLSAPAPGLYTCIKTWKIMYKSDQRYFFETCNK